jgi:hypothetical protein
VNPSHTTLGAEFLESSATNGRIQHGLLSYCRGSARSGQPGAARDEVLCTTLQSLPLGLSKLAFENRLTLTNVPSKLKLSACLLSLVFTKETPSALCTSTAGWPVRSL